MSMALQPKRVRDSQTVISHLMHIVDANPQGHIHGGVVMRLADEVGGICAARHARRPVVTMAMDSMYFHSPIYIGNLVTLRASVNYVGRTSMEVGVRVEAEDVLTGEITHANSAYLVYVALDEDGKPVEVPPLIAETPEEERHMEEGRLRQQERLRRRHEDEARQTRE
jgi:acyl-CoA hydrolase